MSFETAPRVNPVTLAMLLGDVFSSVAYISLSTTHSATVTLLAKSFRAKEWETALETTRRWYPMWDFKWDGVDGGGVFMVGSFRILIIVY